ncbi:MAG: LiaI-LiaF-like domain-containing protein [Acidobacteriaceae bacterium]
MNCANHPDTPLAAYCQFCGKPLCSQCVHRINNIVGCEPCLAARVAAAGAGTYGVNIDDGKGFNYTATGPFPRGGVQPVPSWGTEPWIAFGLGWIPGVGAMYNGQFAKALAHVVIFALLVDFSHYNGVLGVVVAGWVFYQVFDAYQTAIARRDGLPLPNPLGLNDIAHWFGVRTTPPANPWVGNPANPGSANVDPNPANPGAPTVGNAGPAAGFVPTSEYMPPYIPPYVPPTPQNPTDSLNPFCAGGQWGPNRGIHVGAVVLIALGVAFLLGNLGILSEYWMNRGWPILLIGLGVWMAIRHSQKPPVGGAR